jgi:beta-lactamase class A
MIEAYQQAAEAKIKLDDAVTVTDADMVPGSGILTSHFSAGATISLRDTIRLMIVYSDNTATNLVLDKIGIGSTAARMAAWGFPNTKIHAKVFRRDTSVFPERSQIFGLGSTTANEMVGLLEELHGGSRFSDADRTAMLGHLKRCEDKDKFPRFLPPRAVAAHKTGSLDRTRTDAGIIFMPSGPVAVCVLTNRNEDTTWRPDNAGNLLCANIARAVYDHFAAPPAPAGKDIPTKRLER